MLRNPSLHIFKDVAPRKTGICNLKTFISSNFEINHSWKNSILIRPGLLAGVQWSCRNSSNTDLTILICLIEGVCLRDGITSPFSIPRRPGREKSEKLTMSPHGQKPPSFLTALTHIRVFTKYWGCTVQSWGSCCVFGRYRSQRAPSPFLRFWIRPVLAWTGAMCGPMQGRLIINYRRHGSINLHFIAWCCSIIDPMILRGCFASTIQQFIYVEGVQPFKAQPCFCHSAIKTHIPQAVCRVQPMSMT